MDGGHWQPSPVRTRSPIGRTASRALARLARPALWPPGLTAGTPDRPVFRNSAHNPRPIGSCLPRGGLSGAPDAHLTAHHLKEFRDAEAPPVRFAGHAGDGTFARPLSLDLCREYP